MATVSLKLSDELQARAEMAAAQRGISTHAFIVGAIRQAVDGVEWQMQFAARARDARAAMLPSGLEMDADEVRAYLRARLADPVFIRPGAKPWRE